MISSFSSGICASYRRSRSGKALALLGAIPAWPHSRGWGYYPSGALSVVLIIIIVLLLTGSL